MALAFVKIVIITIIKKNNKNIFYNKIKVKKKIISKNYNKVKNQLSNNLYKNLIKLCLLELQTICHQN